MSPPCVTVSEFQERPPSQEDDKYDQMCFLTLDSRLYTFVNRIISSEALDISIRWSLALIMVYGDSQDSSKVNFCRMWV